MKNAVEAFVEMPVIEVVRLCMEHHGLTRLQATRYYKDLLRKIVDAKCNNGGYKEIENILMNDPVFSVFGRRQK